MEDIADLICIDKQFQVSVILEYCGNNNHQYSDTSYSGNGQGRVVKKR